MTNLVDRCLPGADTPRYEITGTNPPATRRRFYHLQWP